MNIFPSVPVSASHLAQAIDHTRLVFSADEDEAAAIARLSREAREAGFFAVCVRPRHVAAARAALQGSAVKVATVIGFPAAKMSLASERKKATIGDAPTAEKVEEARRAVADGADELDIVLPVARFKAEAAQGELTSVREELSLLRDIVPNGLLKVILETDLLTPEEMAIASALCVETGMDMLKTSTGMLEGGQGATPEVIQILMNALRALNAPLGVKASGGVKTRAQALALLQAGATRIGTSNGLALVHPS